HLRIAQSLSAEIGGRMVQAAELAHHFYEARPMIDAATAASYARIAADDASQRFAFSEAARWYTRAIALEHDAGASTTALGDLYFALGRSYDAAGEVDPARDAFITAAMCARATDDAPLP